MTDARPPAVLSIAGSDSGGGAGIQADLKAFAAAGVHGMTAITALTAQNTVGVDAVHQVPGEIIRAQVAAVAADIGVDAVKVGMLGDSETIEVVAAALRELDPVPVVVDPVMVSESGAPLLASTARRSLAETLLPFATVATPNLAEAAVLSGLREEAGQAELAAAVRALGPAAVIVTGGHTATGTDLLDEGKGELLEIPGDLHPPGAAHGSGCTHSSTLAALLARGLPLQEAARGAREAAGRAVAGGLRAIGAGAGPVDVLGIERLGGALGPAGNRTGDRS